MYRNHTLTVLHQALAEEKTAYDRSSGRNIYLRVSVNAIKKLRSEVAAMKGDKGTTNDKARTHEDMLGGLKARTTSFTMKRCGPQPKCQAVYKGWLCAVFWVKIVGKQFYLITDYI